jgi:predicted metal-dependent hydrolase
MTGADPAQGDLFASDDAAVPTTGAVPERAGVHAREDGAATTAGEPSSPGYSPPAGRPIVPASDVTVAGGPPTRTPGAGDPADLDLPRHPRAEREIRLGEHRVAYAFRRARRRSIGFVVGPEGLSVSAPRWVGVREVEGALREKGAWILKKLGEQRERARKQLAARIDWRDGTTIPFLGEPVILLLDPRAGGALGGAWLESDAPALPGVPRAVLHLGLAQSAMPEQIREAVQGWLQRQARRIFEERCRLYAERLGVRFTRIGLSSAQTRWGSANASGAIRLNWRLVHFAMPTIDYVVAHELAHLREMNHSPRFWDVVRSVLPDYAEARGALKTESLPVLD